MKYDLDRAAELAESFHNGNQSHVVREIAKYEPLHAALMAIVIAECLASGSGQRLEEAVALLRGALFAGS